MNVSLFRALAATIIAGTMLTSAKVLANSADPVVEQNVAIWIVGIGTESCATWLSSPQNETEGRIWILGFWSGMNMGRSTGDNQVGSETDGEGILGETKKLCNAAPSKQLMVAAVQVYGRSNHLGFEKQRQKICDLCTSMTNQSHQ